MSADPFALHALRLIHQLGLFHLLLCSPPQQWPLSSTLPSDPQTIALSATETIASLLPPPTPSITRHTPTLDQTNDCPVHLPAVLRDDVQLQEPEIRKRLFLAASLAPLGGITTKEKSKTMWLGDKMLRDVLGVRRPQFVCQFLAS